MTRRWPGAGLLATTALAGLLSGTALPATAQQPPSPDAEPPAGEPYTYEPSGRRDPFVSLARRGVERPTGARPAGLAGVLIEEVAIRGIVTSGGIYVAVLESPDGRTHIVRRDDRLFDGTVKEITADAVVFSQQVNDPLSLVKQRDVRKSLRPVEEGR